MADEARGTCGARLVPGFTCIRSLAEGGAPTGRPRWPFQDRPFGDVVAWVNGELTKNAAEIGYARFLHAVEHGS